VEKREMYSPFVVGTSLRSFAHPMVLPLLPPLSSFCAKRSGAAESMPLFSGFCGFAQNDGNKNHSLRDVEGGVPYKGREKGGFETRLYA
jgi:hypothetical protein